MIKGDAFSRYTDIFQKKSRKDMLEALLRLADDYRFTTNLLLQKS